MRAPQPEPPIPGSFATPSLLAWIVNGKYVMSLPLYRIEADLKACGATISRQDMANWMMNVHARWLAKVHERMKVELLSHVRIHADETTVQVLKEPNREAKKKSRMWLFCSARCDVPVYVFEYHETRRKGVAQEFLAGWSGTLTTDGYKPYFNLGNPNIANTACLVHVRRYFAQIVKIAGGGAKAASAAIYSVTTTAKANGLNPRLYVEWLLTEMPNAGELTDEVVDSFLPWSDRVPESCKLDPAAAEKAKEMPDDFIINIDPDAFDDEMANNAEEGL